MSEREVVCVGTALIQGSSQANSIRRCDTSQQGGFSRRKAEVRYDQRHKVGFPCIINMPGQYLIVKHDRRINATAPIHETVKGVIDLRHILDVNAYNAKRSLTNESLLKPTIISEATYSILQNRRVEHDDSECDGHDHTDSDCDHHSVTHQHARDLNDISTLSIPLPLLSISQRDRLELLLRSLLWDAELPAHENNETITNLEILRTKGIFSVINDKENQDVISRFIIQGVKELYEIKELHGSKNATDGDGFGRLVLIGKGLSEELRIAVMEIIASA